MRRMSPATDTRFDHDHQRRIASARTRVGRIARLLDGLVSIPGTRIRFGLDALLGLIPGIGDIAGLLLGSSILFESVRVGAPRGLIARMLGNMVVDTVGGSVPLVGDLFDVAFRSHARNARLLLDHLDAQSGAAAPKRHGKLMLAGLMLALLLMLGLVCVGLYAVITRLF
jgi:hypothetical protein